MGSGRAGRGNEVVAAAFLTISVFFWGTAFRATLIGTEHASTWSFNALRAVPATLFLLLVAIVLRSRLPRGRTMWAWTAVSGALMVTLALAGLSESVVRAGAGNAAVLANTSPFFVLVLGRLFLGERVSWIGPAGLAVGFAGIVTMVWPQLGGGESGDLVLGLAVALLSAAGWGVGTLMVKRLAERDPQLDLIGLSVGQYLVGAPLLVVMGLAVSGTGGIDWGSIDLWGAVLWVAIGASALGQLLFFAGLKRISASKASAWGFLAPVVAVLVETARGDAPSAIVLIGMVLVIAGVAVVNAAPVRQAAPAPVPSPAGD